MRACLIVLSLHLALLALAHPSLASDHADPIDLAGLKPLEPVITDLFVFPADESGRVIRDVPDRSSELVIILCVRRALTQTSSLKLKPYTYTVHIDPVSPIDFRPGLTRDRYGGRIEEPAGIESTVEIAMRLNNDATLNGPPTITGLDEKLPQPITGIFADPFIFPMFERTNIVGIVLRIPMTCFPDDDQRDFIVWATSRKRGRQIDHVGRSLRTQNPRFDLLNTRPPREHVDAIRSEHEHPSLMRDIALSINLGSLFAFREWDFVPDVLIYSRQFPVGFPNGRMLTDDVVALVAQHGDTLAYELSYLDDGPRKTRNKFIEFRPEPPYLAAPHRAPEASERHSLSTVNKLKIIGIVVVPLVLFIVWTWLFAKWYYWKKHRRRYL